MSFRPDDPPSVELGTVDGILASLKPLFERARRERLWFWCAYQGLWFSPDELEKAHREGSFIWGPDNWRLRDPKELILEAERELASAQRRLAEVCSRVGLPT